MWSNRVRGLMACFLLLAGQAGMADGLDEVRERGVLRIAVYNDYQPFSFKQKSRISGVDVDIAEAIGKLLGVPVSLMPFTADESVGDDLRNMVWKGHYLGSGTADIMMHVPVDPVLAADNDRVQIFAPYFRERIAVVYDGKVIEQLSGLNTFRTHKVGVELDTLADHYLTSIYGGALRGNVAHYMSADEAVAAMRRGEVNAVMGPLSHVEGVLSGKDADRFRTAQMSLEGVAVSYWDVGVAVRSGKEEFAKTVSTVMESLRRDGTIENIFKQHGLSYVAPGT